MSDRKTPEDVVEAAIQLAEVLRARSCDYAFGGALALGYWAAPRGTLDVDVTLFVPGNDLDECVSILQSAHCALQRVDALVSLREHGFCRTTFAGFQLDVFVPTIPFYEMARSRSRLVTLCGQPIVIWDAETLCVFKMMFFRLKDLADVEHIIQVQGMELNRHWVLDQIVEIFGRRDPRVVRWQELVAESPTSTDLERD